MLSEPRSCLLVHRRHCPHSVHCIHFVRKPQRVVVSRRQLISVPVANPTEMKIHDQVNWVFLGSDRDLRIASFPSRSELLHPGRLQCTDTASNPTCGTVPRKCVARRQRNCQLYRRRHLERLPCQDEDARFCYCRVCRTFGHGQRPADLRLERYLDALCCKSALANAWLVQRHHLRVRWLRSNKHWQS